MPIPGDLSTYIFGAHNSWLRLSFYGIILHQSYVYSRAYPQDPFKLKVLVRLLGCSLLSAYLMAPKGLCSHVRVSYHLLHNHSQTLAVYWRPYILCSLGIHGECEQYFQKQHTHNLSSRKLPLSDYRLLEACSSWPPHMVTNYSIYLPQP